MSVARKLPVADLSVEGLINLVKGQITTVKKIV